VFESGQLYSSLGSAAMHTEAPPRHPLSVLEYRLIVIVAALQGIALHWLYKAVDTQQWPSNEPVVLYLLAAVLLTVPLFFILLLERRALTRVLRCVAIYALVIASVASYAGWQTMPSAAVNNQLMLPAFVLTLVIASFKILMYARQYCQQAGFHYSALLQNSWQLCLLVALSALFVLLFWGVLVLWGALFNLIGIRVFAEVFEQQWFQFPASTTAFGFAVILFRNVDHIIGNLARLLKTMLRFLLPLLALVALLFLSFLPFTGLQPIWSSSLGSGSLLWMIALLLFFVNAVYQRDDGEQPYSLWLHRMIAAAMASLPLYGILALHGLFTRVAQYGLTVDRCWGLLASFLLLGFALGYLVSVVRKRDAWLGGLQQINVAMGLVLLTVMLAVNTPLLNFQQWSVHSQLQRLEKGMLLSDLDIGYFRRDLGRPGYLALTELKQRYAATDPAFVASIDQLYAPPIQPPQSVAELRSKLVIWPTGSEVPEPVLQHLLDSVKSGGNNFKQAFVVFHDLDNNGQAEILTLQENYGMVIPVKMWTFSADELRSNDFSMRPSTPSVLPRHGLRDSTAPPLAQDLAEGNVTLIVPRWQSLQIGDVMLVPEVLSSELPTELPNGVPMGIAPAP
jgi:hypothetical protein